MQFVLILLLHHQLFHGSYYILIEWISYSLFSTIISFYWRSHISLITNHNFHPNSTKSARKIKTKIPSIKKFWHEKVHPELSKKEVTELNTFDKVKKKYGEPYGLPFDKNGYTIDPSLGVKKDNKPIPVPMCRECTSQPRCSKWGGKFQYQMEMKWIQR